MSDRNDYDDAQARTTETYRPAGDSVPRPSARTQRRPSVYQPEGHPAGDLLGSPALDNARRNALREREALRRQHPAGSTPAQGPGGRQRSPKPAKKGWFGRRKPAAAPEGRPMSAPEVFYESAGSRGPLPAYASVEARLHASEDVRRDQASAFTIRGGSVEAAGAKRTRSKRGSSMAGGRWRRMVLTAAMTVALTILIVNGLYRLAGKALYDPPVPPPGSGFPVAAASGYAARFAQAYLTWDQASPRSRANALQVFFPDATTTNFGWDGGGKQTLLGPPVVAGVTTQDDTHGVVHLAANLDPGGWACMDVAMYAAAGGTAFAITSYVAFVSCPPAAAGSVPLISVESDTAFAQEIRPLVETFFKQYAASSPEIAQSITQDSGIWGLGGMVTFADLSQIVTPVLANPSADVRSLRVQVRWRLPSGGTLLQAYRLSLQQIGGRWFVDSIEGGVEDAEVAPRVGGAPTPSPGPSTSSPSSPPPSSPSSSPT